MKRNTKAWSKVYPVKLPDPPKPKQPKPKTKDGKK